MKVSISKLILESMLSRVQGFTEKDGSLTILSHVLLDARDNLLTIKATDLHTSIQVFSECEVASKGSCTINGKQFYEFIKALQENKVTFKAEDSRKASVVSGTTTSKFNIMDSEEFPIVEFKDSINGIILDQQKLKDMIDRTYFSIPASTGQETRYTLTGASLLSVEYEDGNYIEMVTTDSRRLSVSRFKLEQKFDMSGIIIPRKGLIELKRLIDTSDESASIILTNESIYYKSKDTMATVRLLDGKFPDHRSVIKIEEYPLYARMNSKELLNALKICSTFNAGDVNCVKFKFGAKTTTLYANNPDQGDVVVPVDSEYKGTEIEINFNPKYFIDSLSQIKDDVEIRLKGTDGPCLVTEKDDFNSIWVIMPLRY